MASVPVGILDRDIAEDLDFISRGSSPAFGNRILPLIDEAHEVEIERSADLSKLNNVKPPLGRLIPADQGLAPSDLRGEFALR